MVDATSWEVSMSRSAMLMLALLLGAALDLAAQAPPIALVPGRRIRVHRRAETTLVGDLVSLGPDSLTMTTSAADTVMVARAAITRLDLSTGTKSKAGKGAVNGLIFGALGGALIGVLASGSDDGDFIDFGPGEWAASGALMFGAVGAGVGALIGAGQRADRWERVALPTVAIVPVPGKGSGVAVGMRFRF
jgi:hypothetical protein